MPNNMSKDKLAHYFERKLGMKNKLIFLFLCLCLLSFVIGLYIPSTEEVRSAVFGWAEKHGHNALRKDVRLKHALLKLPERLFKSFSPLNTNLPQIHIDIKFKHIQKIHRKRAQALSDDILVQEPNDFVPATIRYNNRSIRVKLRLKGDWTDHLEGKKWSFRIHVKKKDALFGMRRFSIQHPKVRGYHGEPLLMETFRHVGVLAPRYFFINVFINGDDLGIMAVEEHFSKELLEFNGRREGVIVRYDESLLWDARMLSRSDLNVRIFHSYKNTMIDAFRSNKIAKSPALSENLGVAVGLLRSFTAGELTPSETFNVELMGRFLAVLEFWGARHSMYWHNLRFYLNPITLKLEPIGYEGDLHVRHEPGEIISHLEPITARILDDPKIFDVYHQTLMKLSKETLDGSLIDKLQKLQDQYIQTLQKEFFLLEAIPFEELKKRANYFLSVDSHAIKKYPIVFPSYPKLLHAFIIKDNKGTHLEMSAIVPHDIKVLSIKWVNKKDPGSTRNFQPASAINLPLNLSETPPGELPNTQIISFEYSKDLENFFLEILASIKGGNKHYKHIAKYYFASFKEHPIPISTPTEQMALHPFMTMNEADKKLFIKQGSWEVDSSIVIPAPFALVIPKGTTLTFPKGEGIFASGALIFQGTAEKPILIRGLPAKDGKSSETWQGIFVQNSERLSQWSYVKVSDTEGIKRPGWNLTGGVTFYKSEVHLRNCVFVNNQAEDALNIVNSKFHIIDTNFNSTISDAFDADFAVGEVEGGLFRDIGKAGGGDAIDISGSRVSVKGTFFKNVSDKAISVGEHSTMSLNNIHVQNAGTAAVSKDGSLLEINDSLINQVLHAGLMAYIKKPEYGSARIIANNINYSGSAAFARVQKGSEIVADGEKIEQEDLDVDGFYDTFMKPGLPK